MPMQRDLYPPNWEAISLAKRNSTDWKCEHCGKECCRPGESPLEFMERIATNRLSECPVVREYIEHPRRFTLTVAHLDQDPQNNDASNLAALCAPCHLIHDHPYRLANSHRKRERQGQLSLLHPNVHLEPAGHGKDRRAIQHPITGGFEV